MRGRSARPARSRTRTRALDTLGLSGAAHPIRRLQHPGGQMMFPLAKGDRLVLAKRAAIGAGAAWVLGGGPDPRMGPVKPQYTDRQVANQKQADQHKLAAFLWELDETASSGQMSRKEASQATRWAAGQAKGPEGYGWTPELANARNYLHANYKPPRGGWEP